MIWIKLSHIFRTTSIIRSLQHTTYYWRGNREKLVETTFSSRWWETRREIFTALVIWTISLSTLSRKYRLQAKSWCTLPWEVGLKWIKCLNPKLVLYRLKKDLEPNWIQPPKNTWIKWIKFKRKEQNQLPKLDLLIWCQTLSKMVWISMLWLIVLSQILSFIKTIRILGALRVSLQHRESTECKYFKQFNLTSFL